MLYNVHIDKSSLNPKSFWNPMKTDQREAYQSSTVGLFSCFWTTSWKIAKIITYMVKIFCHWKVIMTSGTTKFEEEKRKLLHPLPPKNGRVCGKITTSAILDWFSWFQFHITSNISKNILLFESWKFIKNCGS